MYSIAHNKGYEFVASRWFYIRPSYLMMHGPMSIKKKFKLCQLLQTKPSQLLLTSCNENKVLCHHRNQSRVINEDYLNGMVNIHALYVGDPMFI
jgi:hypothetical protein